MKASANKTINGTVFIRPGDLHLTERGLDNYECAQWMIDEVNEILRPDFVQFAGDNVQNADPEEFRIFRELTDRLNVPWQAMVGDHDIIEDTSARNFRDACGETYGVITHGNTVFIRLNSCESRPVGFSDRQLDWFELELIKASMANLKIVVFQHHYPFKVCESFDGPGIDRWRSLVRSHKIEAIFTGHTHYGQIANDGTNISIATRSIGDPEGGSSGYHLVYYADNKLAAIYRTREQAGPIVLIVSPRASILAKDASHIVTDHCEIEVMIWSRSPAKVFAMIDDKIYVSLERASVESGNPHEARWTARIPGPWTKGSHRLSVTAETEAGKANTEIVDFLCDATGRYTAVPRVEPFVELTAFC